LKDIYLTKGDLSNHELDWEKSAEAIVVTGNEPRIETVEDSQRSEGLNVKFVPNSIRKLLGLSQSSLILNKDRKCFGEKSEMPILDEPPYTRPVRSSRSGRLLSLSPLRTVLESFPSYGSSTLKTTFVVRSSLFLVTN